MTPNMIQCLDANFWVKNGGSNSGVNFFQLRICQQFHSALHGHDIVGGYVIDMQLNAHPNFP